MLNRNCPWTSSSRNTTVKMWGCIELRNELRNELRKVDWL
jgi:hypothetical protein